MFRITKTLTLTADAASVNLQTVRWARKPKWMPIAKSKLFKIPARPVMPTDEDEESKRLNNNYRTVVKSLRKYLYNKYTTSITDVVDHEHHKTLFEEDYARCKEINDRWNESIRAEREEFFENALLHDIEVAQRRLAERQEIAKVSFQQAEEAVRIQKEASKDFITPENIDAAIEHALLNPVDYNFSIDLEGNRYYGREAKPQQKETDNGKQQASVKQ